MSPWDVASAASVGAAMLLWRPPHRWIASVRLPSQLVGADGRASPGPRRGRLAAGAVLASVVLVWLAPLLAGAAAPALVALTLVGVGGFVSRQVRAQRRRSEAAATRVAVCGALDLLAADLRGGILPAKGLASAGGAVPAMAPASAAAERGGDVAAGLRAGAARPGAEALAQLGGAWTVAERAGAPLATVVDRLAATVREDLELVREVASEAAPARATGRLMAVLPVLGLGLGAGMGADPVHLLTRTVPGALCLAAGSALACLGTWWVDRVAASAEVRA